jgi:predicted nucleotidyltransferase
MTQFKLNLENDVESAILSLIKVAKANNIEFFLIGATARDIILTAWGLSPLRATRDVDFAAIIQDWNEFGNFRTYLMENSFKQTSSQHRFIKSNTIIDIVPFGGIEHPIGQITWPESSNIMSTIGFSEAYQATHLFHLPNDQILRVANFCSLSLLKIISWNDRPQERVQDAVDLLQIIKNYLDVGNFDRFYDQHSDLTEMEPYTIPRAGAALLGRDLKALCKEQSLNHIKGILTDQLSCSSSLLVSQMSQENFADLEENKALIEILNSEL